MVIPYFDCECVLPYSGFTLVLCYYTEVVTRFTILCSPSLKLRVASADSKPYNCCAFEVEACSGMVLELQVGRRRSVTLLVFGYEAEGGDNIRLDSKVVGINCR